MNAQSALLLLGYDLHVICVIGTSSLTKITGTITVNMNARKVPLSGGAVGVWAHDIDGGRRQFGVVGRREGLSILLVPPLPRF